MKKWNVLRGIRKKICKRRYCNKRWKDNKGWRGLRYYCKRRKEY